MADDSVQSMCPISQLLEKLGETIIDPVIVDYLNGILNGNNFTDNCDENALRVELREAICAFSPKFAALTDEEQIACCNELIIIHLVAERKGAHCETDSNDHSCESTESRGKEHGDKLSSSLALQESQRASVERGDASNHQGTLQLLSGISQKSFPEEFIHYLLFEHCHGNVDAAANLILAEEQEIDMLLTSWTAKLHRLHHKESPLDKASRQAILQKYHLEAIPDPISLKSKPQGPFPLDLREFSKKGGGQENQKTKAVRYRDGEVVSTKGEKYIIEKPEEWDGGSRGKVKSKRKGGVGWR